VAILQHLEYLVLLYWGCGGVPIVQHAKRMKFSDLNYMCNILFEENNNELRCLFSLDWIGVGRISEVMKYFLNRLIYFNVFISVYTVYF
jgi:hypothetical protein